MANLLGQNIGTNYKGILSLDSTINTPLDATLRAVTDGEGNVSPLELSTDAVSLGGATGANWDNTNKRLGIGTNAPTSNFDVKSTAISFVFAKFLANNGNEILTIRNNSDNSGNIIAQNVTSFSIGTNTTTAKLSIKGSGTTSATTALLVQNSAGADLLKVTDDGSVTANNLLIPNFNNITSGSNNINFQTSRILWTSSFNTPSGQYAYNFGDGGGFSTQTSGILGRFNLSSRFAPTSGTAIYNTSIITPIINQTGGANGITRGLFIDPTLTAAFDFRAIETTNGNVVFGNLPTSAAGLPIGAIWNNSGVINIV